MSKTIATAVVTALVCISGCNRSGESSSAKTEQVDQSGQMPDTSNGATVSGKVSFTGKAPAEHVIDMSANPACQKAHPQPVSSGDVVISGDGSLANAFVWVKEGVPEGKWAPPKGTAVVDQQGCIYTPHVSGVVVGQKVEFRNSDDTNHNIHPLPRTNDEWNESQPPKGDPKIKTFSREEVMVPVKCNIHPWMRAYIGVVRHPFFAVTQKDGSFRIAGLPPGKYTLEAWHERFGRKEIPITLAAKDIKSVDFSFASAE